MSNFKFPSAFTILFILIALVATATWFVPVGEFDRVHNEQLGKDVPVPGTFKSVEPNPQGIEDVLLAPINGFYNIDSYEAAAIDVALFILMIGGFLGVVNKTGAIDVGIKSVMANMRGREILMIPILMSLFAAGGTIYGMAEESLAFYAILIPRDSTCRLRFFNCGSYHNAWLRHGCTRLHDQSFCNSDCIECSGCTVYRWHRS